MSNPYSAPGSLEQPTFSVSAEATARRLKIITLGLLAGALTFLGIALVISRGDLNGEPDIVAWIGIGLAVVEFMMHFIIPNIAANRSLQQVNASAMREANTEQKIEMVTSAFQTRHIIACALLEGAAFLNIVIYIITKFWGNVAAACVCIAFIAFRLPSGTSIEWWAQERIPEIEARP